MYDFTEYTYAMLVELVANGAQILASYDPQRDRRKVLHTLEMLHAVTRELDTRV